MSAFQKKLLLIDLICIAISSFIFLYISPSTEVRQRMLYIIPQVCMCAFFVIMSRFLVGVYKEYFLDQDGKNLTSMYLHLVIADTIACVLFYLFQLLLPEGPMRITLIRVVCIIVFNLVEAIVCRLCLQTGFAMNKDNKRILDAVARSGKSVDEIIALIEK